MPLFNTKNKNSPFYVYKPGFNEKVVDMDYSNVPSCSDVIKRDFFNIKPGEKKMAQLTGDALEAELKEVIKMCRKLQNDKSPLGGGVFFPPKEEIYLYEELVERGDMVVNPIETEGFMFAEEYERLYRKKPGRRGKKTEITEGDIVTVKEDEDG